MNKVKKNKILYIVLTKNCPLDCPFCFNKFADNFSKCSTKPIPLEFIKYNIDKIDPDVVNFIGGEPLLYPQLIIDTLKTYDKNKKIMWCISTNLYYKNISELQLKALKMIQEYSSEYVSIGTSFNVDRFQGFKGFGKEYYDIFYNNMHYLYNNDIRMGITVTIDKEQLEMIPEELMVFLRSLMCYSVNLERCIYPTPESDEEKKELKEFYSKADEYMMECFKLIPTEMNYQYRRFYESVLYEVPIFDNHCSNTIWTLYEHGLYNGCPLNKGDNSQSIYIKKLIDNDCYNCKYYPYCKGDCECNRGMCAFPKQTVDYMSEIVNKDLEDRLEILGQIKKKD